jgi:hypothetical protein
MVPASPQAAADLSNVPISIRAEKTGSLDVPHMVKMPSRTDPAGNALDLHHRYAPAQG